MNNAQHTSEKAGEFDWLASRNGRQQPPQKPDRSALVLSGFFLLFVLSVYLIT